MFAGACRLDGRVERQQVGLPGDFLDDRNLRGDRPHGLDRLGHRGAAFVRGVRRLLGNSFRLAGVLGGLLDVGSHLLHRGRRLLGGRGLLGRALTHLLGGGRELLAAGGHGSGGPGYVRHDPAQAARKINPPAISKTRVRAATPISIILTVS